MTQNDKPARAGAEPTPIACRLSGQDYARRLADVATLLAEAQQTRELADGYAFQFPGSAAILQRLLDYIIAERDCCPFFTFTVVCEPDHGPVWLHLQGPEGVKAAIAETVPSGAPATGDAAS